MASFLKVAARNGLHILRSNAVIKQRFVQPSCLISTSKKNKDSATINESILAPAKTEEKLLEKEENWISFGYSLTDRNEDEWSHKMVLFFMVTVGLGGMTFLFAYFPDFKLTTWAQREAFLELHRRERDGLPLVDPNLIDPAKIELPSDEELGDTDIII